MKITLFVLIFVLSVSGHAKTCVDRLDAPGSSIMDFNFLIECQKAQDLSGDPELQSQYLCFGERSSINNLGQEERWFHTQRYNDSADAGVDTIVIQNLTLGQVEGYLEWYLPDLPIGTITAGKFLSGTGGPYIEETVYDKGQTSVHFKVYEGSHPYSNEVISAAKYQCSKMK